MMPIMGKPMIERLVERIKHAKQIEKIIITTSDEKSDDPLAAFASDISVHCYRGSLNDIMGRICGAAEKFSCDTIVEILGDNPLTDPTLIDAVVAKYQQEDVSAALSLTNEYKINSSKKSLFALGIRVQVFSLAVAQRYKDFPDHTKNDLPEAAFIFSQPELFPTAYIEAIGPWRSLNRPDLNFAVNYRTNFEFVERIYEALYSDNPNFSMLDVMNYTVRHPDALNLLGAD